MRPLSSPATLLPHLQRALMLAAALVLGLLPAGVMPGRDPQGALVLVLCSADGAASVVLDPATGAPLAAEPGRCLWSMPHAPAVMPEPSGSAAPVLRLAGRLRPVPAAHALPPAPPAAPLPRGPPPLA